MYQQILIVMKLWQAISFRGGHNTFEVGPVVQIVSKVLDNYFPVSILMDLYLFLWTYIIFISYTIIFLLINNPFSFLYDGTFSL